MSERAAPVLTATVFADREAHERQQRGTRQLLLARVCLFASSYIVAAFLARRLGTVDYGIYGVIISQLLWLETVLNAGVPGAAAKLIADGRHDPREVERSARALLLGPSLFVLTVSWVLAPAVADFMRIPNGTVLIRIAILDVPLAMIYATYDGILFGRGRFAGVAVAQVVHSGAKFAGVAWLIAFGFSVERVLIAHVIATCAVCVVLFIRFPPAGMRFCRPIVREIASFAAPTALYFISGQVLINLDLWSLQVLWRGDGEVIGQYVASLNLAKTLTVIPAVQAGVLFASVARAVAFGEGARARLHIQEAARFALVIGAGACVILAVDGAATLSMLFSSAYAEGSRFLPLHLAAFALFAGLDVFALSLLVAGRQWFVACVLVVTVPFVWLGNYLLIPRVGPMGAAMSMLLGVALATAVIGAMTYRRFGSPVRFATVIRVLVAAALVGLVSAAFHVQGPLFLVKLLALGSLYLLVLHGLGEITAKDFGLFRKKGTAERAA